MTNSSIFFVFYGLIQGITEFIPISSSGHLNILEIFFKNLESRNYLYETSAHFASLLALLLYLFANRHFSKSNIKAYWKILIYATIPAIILGFIIKSPLLLHLANPTAYESSEYIFIIFIHHSMN